jgi:transcriptional regulator with XRE-family HTH domain
MTPGNRVRRARKQNGLSLRELEERTAQQGLKISRSTLSKIERDKHNPTIRQMQTLCLSLNMSADWCLLGDNQPAYAIGRKTIGLPEPARQLILNVIDTLKTLVSGNK